MRQDIITLRNRWRFGVLLVMAFGLVGCAELYEDAVGEPDRLGADARVSTNSDPESETYPSLGTVPDQPRRQPSQQNTRQDLQQSLSSDRANARYSNEPLEGRHSDPVATAPPEPADVSMDEANVSSDGHSRGNASGGEDTGTLQDGERLSPGETHTMAADQPEPDRAGRRQADGDVPEMPEFARTRSQSAAAETGNGEVSSAVSAMTGREQMAARSRSVSKGDPAQTADADGERRVALIYFNHGSTGLDARDREVLGEVVDLAERRGSNLHVVGHASSRTAGMGLIEHRMANFDTSLKRAEAVADALVSMGIARERIRVEARSDHDPVYHEYIPTGEAGNRRAEVFLTR